MQIKNSTLQDIDTIFDLYTAAIEHQKKVFNKHWLPFDRRMVEKEILENRQWKIIINDEVACIFAITHNDPMIWKEKDKDPSVYIHRIVTNPSFRGQYFVKDIIAWARIFCRENGKEFIRMDTWGDNQKLIDYYTQCGFKFLGITQMGITEDLPKHYQNASLSLFEISII
ncbi:MAG: GNAT family N-acetyltransferase [Cyclobacteriaceae bacterium]|nr:GNAT family N-acetyltransferase [Cyclobacteriaceae bacterium]